MLASDKNFITGQVSFVKMKVTIWVKIRFKVARDHKRDRTEPASGPQTKNAFYAIKGLL